MAIDEIPEGEFYSLLYVEPGVPLQDSEIFRRRIGAYFVHDLGDHFANYCGQQIEIEIGHKFSMRPHFSNHIEKYLLEAPLVNALTAITLIWRVVKYRAPPRAGAWRAFVARALAEGNLNYRIDSKGGIHPKVDQEFERSRVSVIACLMDARYATVRHAAEASYEQLAAMPMDGKGAARNVFEAAEALTKIVTGSSNALDERFVDKSLRPLCDCIFANDQQLLSTAGRLLSSFGKWVDAIHPFRHGHDRDRPLVLPDNMAILAVSQGASFIRWLVDIDVKINAPYLETTPKRV